MNNNQNSLLGVVWFREDLRLYDNNALFHATQKCNAGVVGVYIVDPQMWHKHAIAACRVEFILRGLRMLSDDLAKLNIPLVIINITNSTSLANELFNWMHSINARALFFNYQYEVNESRRDQTVQRYLTKNDILCYGYDDQVILPPKSIITQQEGFYKVFTPYKRAWYSHFEQGPTIKLLLPIPKLQPPLLHIKSTTIPDSISGFTSSIRPDLWPAGETIARKRLHTFITQHLYNYDKRRDFPAFEGTSQLSPYLATGMISPRTCFMAAYHANDNKLNSGNNGAIIWMSELIWREFYKYILVTVPRVSMGKPFHMYTNQLPWRDDETLLAAWTKGNTGYPMIDAAMRQLNSIGWMHNRLRMVVAMFLSKNLFLHWQLGEKYFMNHLIDGDLAANNGGWQWSASTGVDAVPYFRVFNPVRQSERFDPDGIFIRQYCPELASLNNKMIHDPSTRAPQLIQSIGYPPAIIDVNKSRIDFIAAFKDI